jgi:hypothetical protein
MSKLKFARGMRVEVKGDPIPWTILDHHPARGCWWLHRWIGDTWEYIVALYTEMNQVFR